MMQGADSEDRALQFLQAQGLHLIVRNWRCRAGELDLVMRHGDTVVVAEVRGRGRSDYGAAAETVDPRKQRKIVRATRLFLAQRGELAEQPLRFDVVALDGNGAIEWLRAAFEVEE